MPRLINPVDWTLLSINTDDNYSPLVSLRNSKGHQFHVHPIDEDVIKVVHTLPFKEGQPRLRNHDRASGEGVDGFHWERRRKQWEVQHVDGRKEAIITSSRIGQDSTVVRQIQLKLDYSYSITLTWSFLREEGNFYPFLKDFKNAYLYDARTQRVFHQVCREQSYIPESEHTLSANDNHIPQRDRFEYIYGLGESKGCMMKDGKRYIIDSRDSLAADPQETDPLYKLCPFYLHYNSKTKFWYGLYYNTLSPSIFDFSGEHDFATGEFRSFSAEAGPLDYYLLVGNSVASIVSQFARLVTPYSKGPIGNTDLNGWQASPTLPPASQFGYLASSLALSERKDAQEAVIDYVLQARTNGFPIDSIHLSSGYALDTNSGDRNYFVWDPIKYPDPKALGQKLERDMSCKIIINVKPWLLEAHPHYIAAARRGAFIRAAPDARFLNSTNDEAADADRCGRYASEPARTMHWSKGMGETNKGSYFDFSSRKGCDEWQRLMDIGVLNMGITGLWIDNNEFSSSIDDEEELKGDINPWIIPEILYTSSCLGESEKEVGNRMGWGDRSTSIGSVGRGVQTMGMARATFQRLYASLGNKNRPYIVTRATVPGIQAYTHASWSGDNSTTWLSLRWSTKLTLSVGLSFGVGLYGHDVGGFAGPNVPSSDLLVRWCQQSMWHTRFTIHSWKEISTTPWMYGKEETDIIRDHILLRYRLIPMLYSLYVTDYHRRAWPVLKPMLWFHSSDWHCLTLDEQFLVGSHVLVAPVCNFKQRKQNVYLPDTVDGEDGSDASWFELEANKWHRPSVEGNEIVLDAPLNRLPTLVRDGGIIVMGPTINSFVSSPLSREIEREIRIFPRPAHLLSQDHKMQARNNSKGTFTLVEDDGTTNDATHKGHFAQIKLCFEADSDFVKCGAVIEIAGYNCNCRLTFVLPPGDQRRLVADLESLPKDESHTQSHEETSERLILFLSIKMK